MSHPVYDEDGTLLGFLAIKPGETMTVEEQRTVMKTLAKCFQHEHGSKKHEMGETHAKTRTARNEWGDVSGEPAVERPTRRRT